MLKRAGRCAAWVVALKHFGWLRKGDADVLDVNLMISNGGDTNRLRDIASSAATQIAHHFTYELGQPVTFANWDYRRDAPGVVPAGKLAARSLAMVEQCECLLAIFGPTVPNITSQEVIRFLERRQAGERVDFWLFLNPDEKGPDHDQFLYDVTKRFGIDIVWSGYRDELEFQGKVMTTLFGFLTQRVFTRQLVIAGPQ